MAVNQSYGIKAAVGAQPMAVNNRADVEVVQRLLNEHASKVGYSPLPVNGVVTQQMIQAIQVFQSKVVGMRSPDGRVDPNGKTILKLNQPPGAGPAVPAVPPPHATPDSGAAPLWTYDPVAREAAIATMIQFATSRALPGFKGICSRYVANAINAGIPAGAKRLHVDHGPMVVLPGKHPQAGGPESGGRMGPKLVTVGYRSIAVVAGANFPTTIPLEPGDVIVVKSVSPSTGIAKDGHVAIWTGTSWVSDCIQPGGRNPNVYINSTTNRVVQYELFQLHGKPKAN